MMKYHKSFLQKDINQFSNFSQVCFNSYKDSGRVIKFWHSLRSKVLCEYDASDDLLNTFHIDDIEMSLRFL